MTARLAELDLRGVGSVFIDELHFYEDAIEFVAHCLSEGIQLKATTLFRDLVGCPMEMVSILSGWDGVKLRFMSANCDCCG